MAFEKYRLCVHDMDTLKVWFGCSSGYDTLQEDFTGWTGHLSGNNNQSRIVLRKIYGSTSRAKAGTPH